MLIKILKRTADFAKTIETDKKIEAEHVDLFSILPKKSKIFTEQMSREKQNAPAIHNIFQSELWRMRLGKRRVEHSRYDEN
jgi:hypothetical protein